MTSYHLVILVHGRFPQYFHTILTLSLWGNISHMKYLQDQLESQRYNSKEEIVVYRTGSHEGFLTYDGIDVNGKRVADEIQMETNRLNHDNNEVTKVSIVGYSLGGLISRYAIGILYFQGYFNTIEPINFITFCSPHVGVLTPGNGIAVKLFNAFVPHFLAHTGAQFFMLDKKYSPKSTDAQLPLLVWMAEPKSFFFKALAGFKHRALYGNIINDKRTSWFTSSISTIDPFQSISNDDSRNFNLAYIKGYEPTVIDINQPMKITKVNDTLEDKYSKKGIYWQNLVRRNLNLIKVVGMVFLITPIWGCYFIFNSIFQRIKLNRRVNSFFKDTSNSLAHLYQLVEDEVNTNLIDLNEEDDLDFEKRHSINNTSAYQTQDQDQDQEENEDVENDNVSHIRQRLGDQTEDLVQSVFDAMNSEKYKDYHYQVSSANNIENMSKSINDKQIDESSFTVVLDERSGNPELYTDFILDLNPQQKRIVSNLNSISWKKFPILIRNTKATHAAAIVRMTDPKYNFEEGKTVVSHFVKEIFQTD